MLPITARFKGSWKVDATIRRAGRDQWGDPLPNTDPRTVEDCLFAPTSSTEGTDLSEVPDDTAKLLAPPGTDVASDDRIDVPGAGTYWVAGTPKEWPLGVSIQLTRSQKKARTTDA
jgi:hypothetical protein